MIDTSVIRARFTAVERDLNERSRRLLAAAEAKTAGYGGITAASLATGMARSTIGRGLKDLAAPDTLAGEVRRPVLVCGCMAGISYDGRGEPSLPLKTGH